MGKLNFIQPKSTSYCILIHSKDCYEKSMLECLDGVEKHLPEVPVYVTTENNSLSHNNVTNILTGDGVFSERLNLALDVIDCENIIFLLEDMVIKAVDIVGFSRVVDFHCDFKHDLTKFGNHEFFGTVDTGKRIGGYKQVYYKEYCILKHHFQPYRISHQPVSIWKKEFLQATLDKPVSPWEHESETNDRLSRGEFGERSIYAIGSYPAIHCPWGSDYGEIIQYHHLLTKGQEIPYVGVYT